MCIVRYELAIYIVLYDIDTILQVILPGYHGYLLRQPTRMTTMNRLANAQYSVIQYYKTAPDTVP